MPGTYGKGVSYVQQTPTGMVGAYSTGNTVSLNEFWGVGSGISGYKTPMEQMTENIKANGWEMAVRMIAIPIAFRVGKQLGRPAINQTNRLLNNVGLKAVKL